MPMLTTSVMRRPSKPRPVAAADGRDEFLQPAQDVVDRRHDVAAVDLDRAVAAVAERDVEGGAALGRVDALAPEHALDPGRQFRLVAPTPAAARACAW